MLTGERGISWPDTPLRYGQQPAASQQWGTYALKKDSLGRKDEDAKASPLLKKNTLSLL